MKKTLALLLSLLMLCFAAVPSLAADQTEDAAALQAKFREGITIEGTDYVYFAPHTGLIDTTRYPLLVFLHGEDVGASRRSQLDKNGFYNFASTAFQSKFKGTGGCFLFAPRRNGGGQWQSGDTKSLKSAIDQFVSMYQTSINSDCIYLFGYSNGADMVWNMLRDYPDFFAAAMPAATLTQPEKTTTDKLKNTAVWMFSCDKDTTANANTLYARQVFNNLKAVAAKPASVRLTAFSNVVTPDGQFILGQGSSLLADTHSVWYAVTNNMHMQNGAPYSYQVTLDGAGNYFDFNDNTGVIDWLSQQSLESEPDNTPDEARVPSRLLEFILSIFTRLFNRLFSWRSSTAE